MTRSRRRKLSRRQFLKTSAAVGATVALPGFLVACGDDDGSFSAPQPTPTPVRGARERRTLHFDLSHNGSLREARLVALNSDSYQAQLRRHTAKTRQRFRQSTPELNAVADENLTHFLEDVDLPADALQLLTVIGTTSGGAPALLGAYIHIPCGTLQDYAARAARSEAVMPKALMHRYGTAANGDALGNMLVFSNAYVTPLTTAVALCFHHPEVMNLNTQLGANTLIAYIENLPADCTDPTQGCKFVDPLAFWIATHSPATTTPGGWATLVAQTDANNQLVVDQNGDQVYRYDLTDDTLAQIATPVQEILKAVFDDPRYEGSNWNATTGVTRVDQSASAASEATDSALQLQATLPVGSTHNGIEFVSLAVTDSMNRSVQLAIKNRYLRWLRAYAQYLTPDGTALPVAGPDSDDTTRAKFIREITSNNQIMGIPLMGNAVGNTCLEFEIPAAASTARIFIGSLGLGGEAFCPEAVVGSALTLAFNIGLPTLLLLWGIGETASAGISVLADNPALRKAILSSLRSFLIGNGLNYGVGIYGSDTSKDAICFISALSNSLIQALLTAGPLFVQYLAIQDIGQAAAAVPIVGWIFKIAEIAATLAAIAVTVGEVLASQALTTNDITIGFDAQVDIEHDPNDFRFPPEADTYVVTITLSKTVVYTATGAIDPPGGQRTDPIPVTLKNIPSGGSLTIDVVLQSAGGSIAATGTVGPLAATPEAAGVVSVPLTNRTVPLTSQTQYQHDLKLAYQSGARVWMQTPAPTATVGALECAINTDLCELSQITVGPRTGMLGYAWRTGGLGVGQCDGGPGGVLHTFQNVFAASPAQSALKFAGCGFTLPAGLAYDPKGPPNGTGNNFFFAPAADGDGFFLRSVTLDTTTPFDVAQTMNWGRFTQSLDSVAVHPAGYVTGVASATHKIEILALPDGAVSDAMPAMSPWATMRAGLGTRAGLLDTPVAVAVHNGAILVLEQGNRRIQAFDTTANPVEYFSGQSDPFAALIADDASVVYVDLAHDALGYLFVLSYVNDGATAADYRLDIYDPDGTFLTRTTGIAAARMTVDPFRTLYTVNYEAIAGAPRVEPSLSQWIPSTPGT
jgi:hypothetical protein